MRSRRNGLIYGVLCLVAVLGSAAVAPAQETVVIGRGLPQVRVNLDVLDGLGHPPRPPKLVVPGLTRAGTIRLVPPSRAGQAPSSLPRPSVEPSPPVVREMPLVVDKPAEPVPPMTVAEAVAPLPSLPPPPATPDPAVVVREPPPPEPDPPVDDPSVRVAALSPAAVEEVSIAFSGDAVDLSGAGQGQLADIVARLAADSGLRAQVKAYARGSTSTDSAARRLSLSRALAVRSYLIEKGVWSTRIDVRALGNKSADGPPERVDVAVAER